MIASSCISSKVAIVFCCKDEFIELPGNNFDAYSRNFLAMVTRFSIWEPFVWPFLIS